MFEYLKCLIIPLAEVFVKLRVGSVVMYVFEFCRFDYKYLWSLCSDLGLYTAQKYVRSLTMTRF